MKKNLFLGLFALLVLSLVSAFGVSAFAQVTYDTKFDFSFDSAGWYLGTNGAVIGHEEGAMAVSASDTEANPIIMSSQVAVDAASNRYMIITMKNTVDTKTMTMFFSNELNGFTGDGDAVLFNVNQNEDYALYAIDMSAYAKWQGTIVHFRWDLTDDPSAIKTGTVYVKSIEFTDKLPAITSDTEYDTKFDFSEDSAGWYLGTNGAVIGHKEGAMAVSASDTEANPIIMSSQVAVDAASNRYMIITMKNTVDTSTMTMFFSNELNGFTGDGDAAIFNVNQDSNYAVYVIDMGVCLKWQGTIVHFRWDLTDDPSAIKTGTAYVKSIEFASEIPEGAEAQIPRTPSDFGKEQTTFNFEQGTYGWYAGPNVEMSKTAEGLRCEITKEDSFIVSDEMEIPGTNRYMIIILKNMSDTCAMQLLFARDYSENINGENCVTFTVKPQTDGFDTYVVDLGIHGNWPLDDYLLRVRLDLNVNETKSGTVVVKSVSFTDVKPDGFDDNKVSYDLTESNGGFVNTNHISGFITENGSTRLTINGRDPFIVSPYGLGVSTDYRYLRITMRSDCDAKFMTVYFMTDYIGSFNESALCYFNVERTYDFVTYVIDLSENPMYYGTVTMLRFDVNDEKVTTGNVYVKSIEFAKESEPGYFVENEPNSSGGIYYPGISASDHSETESVGKKGKCGSSVGAEPLFGIVIAACAAMAIKKKKNA